MPDSRRLHASLDEGFVEPRGHLVAKVHADCGLDRIQDQHEHEHDTGQNKGSRD
jgi:hypothetical protein